MTKSAAAATLWLVQCPGALAPRDATADAVTDWNATRPEPRSPPASLPSRILFTKARLYAMMHVAIHDALNAIDRRSRPYAFRARVGTWASPDAAVAAAARDVLVPLIGQIGFPFPPPCIDAGMAVVEGRLPGGARRHPRRSGKDEGHQARAGGGRGDSGPEKGRRGRHAAAGFRLPAGHDARRVSLHARFRFRVRARMGTGHAIRAGSQGPFRRASRRFGWPASGIWRTSTK